MTAQAVHAVDELPWLQDAMSVARAALLGDRAPHSLLVVGQPGAGLRLFADWLIALRHCRQQDAAPCGKCRSCLWLAEGNHPDHVLLTPLEDSKEIRIDQVRELLVQLAMTGHGGRYRTSLLWPAERLNRNAANSFLKMLEEPPSNSLLVLATAAPSRLPATIRSRCLRISLPTPSRKQSAQWLHARCGGQVDAWLRVLEVAGNNPAQACAGELAVQLESVQVLEQETMALAEGKREPLHMAKTWDDERYEIRLLELENLVTKYLISVAGTSKPHLLSLAEMTKLRPMFELIDRVREDRLLAPTPVNRRHGLTVLLSATQAAWRSASMTGRHTR